jgi:hypothetical protein
MVAVAVRTTLGRFAVVVTVPWLLLVICWHDAPPLEARPLATAFIFYVLKF